MRVSVADGGEIAEVRRRHLAALAYELEARGLSCRLAGPGESVLSVHGPRTLRQVMVVVTPVGAGWSYLWAGGGMADAATTAVAADRIAGLLG
ncbi:hypothetical protein [Actinomadura napierensis]